MSYWRERGGIQGLLLNKSVSTEPLVVLRSAGNWSTYNVPEPLGKTIREHGMAY